MGSKGELPNAHIRIEWAGGVLGDFVFLVDESGGLCPREKKESFCICIFADTISGVFLELISSKVSCCPGNGSTSPNVSEEKWEPYQRVNEEQKVELVIPLLSLLIFFKYLFHS